MLTSDLLTTLIPDYSERTFSLNTWALVVHLSAAGLLLLSDSVLANCQAIMST